MRDFSKNHEWLSINTATVRKSRGKDLPLTDIIEACVSRGIKAISPWRDQVAAVGPNQTLTDPVAAGFNSLAKAHTSQTSSLHVSHLGRANALA